MVRPKVCEKTHINMANDENDLFRSPRLRRLSAALDRHYVFMDKARVIDDR